MQPWWQELFHPSLWDWGDVATWVQGVATAGSLWLGFGILRSDRKREERAQAAKIHARLVAPFVIEPDLEGACTVFVVNRSDSPIFSVHPLATPLPPTQRLAIKGTNSSYRHLTDSELINGPQIEIGTFMRDGKGISTVEPGEELGAALDLPFSSAFYSIRVEFSDINGVRWIRPVDSHNFFKYTRKHYPIAEKVGA
jgi:hypothetical protein